MSNPTNLPVHRAVRCGYCYWCLYDGDYCQNPACKMYGKAPEGNRVYLTNEEYQLLTRLTAPTPASLRSLAEWFDDPKNPHVAPVVSLNNGTVGYSDRAESGYLLRRIADELERSKR